MFESFDFPDFDVQVSISRFPFSRLVFEFTKAIEEELTALNRAVDELRSMQLHE